MCKKSGETCQALRLYTLIGAGMFTVCAFKTVQFIGKIRVLVKNSCTLSAIQGLNYRLKYCNFLYSVTLTGFELYTGEWRAFCRPHPIN